MAKKKNKAVESENLAFHILDAFVDKLAAEADANPGTLNADKIRDQAESFKDGGSAEVLAAFRENLDGYMREHERDIWGQTRKKPFDRILVRRFSNLFPAEGELDTGGSFLSRRILPGFFMAIEMMAGPKLFEQCHGACRVVVTAKREEAGANFRWRMVYEDASVIELINDLLVIVATHFEDFEKRREWLHELIDSHLAPVDDYTFEGETAHDWRFQTSHTITLLKALYEPFEAILDDNDFRHHEEKRYGLKAVRAIEDLIRTLNK